MSGKRMVIFGCGYVGRALARAAGAAGYEVWIHSRNAVSLAMVDAVPEERRIVGDLHSDAWHGQLPGKWDVAVNLVSSAGGGLDGYRISYLGGNQSIRKWAEGNPVERFVYSSATSVYPQTDGEWVSEEDVPAFGQLSPSGQLLRQAELEILQSTVYGGSVIARLGGIYGPGRHLYLNSLQGGLSELSGDGSAWLNLIYLDDIVEALLRLSSCQMEETSLVVNLVDNEPSRKQDIVDWLAGQLGVPSIPFNPANPGVRAPRRISSGGLPNRRIRNDRIKKLLDWEPRYPSYREGYGKIIGNA